MKTEIQKTKRRILYFPKSPAPFNEACLSLTPKVSSIHESLFLDIEPTQKLFGGEKRILFNATQLASTFGLGPQLVVTDRPEWARALQSSNEVVIPTGKSFERLLALEISRLEYCGDPSTLGEEAPEKQSLIQFMKRVGMRSILDFTQLSPTAIGRRFGKMGISLHEWTLGTREALLPPFIPETLITEKLDAEEITSMESLLFCLNQVFIRMEARLRGRAALAKAIKLKFSLDSHETIEKTLPLSAPMQEASRILKLLSDFLRELTWNSPLQELEVCISDTVPYTPGQLSLFDSTENSYSDLAQYITRLRARFGEVNVGFPSLQESYLPERSWENTWPPRADNPASPQSERPFFIYSPPWPCIPKQNWELIPMENLMTEWWVPGGFRRYFIATPPQGKPLWIFWDLEQKAWYAHGTYD